MTTLRGLHYVHEASDWRLSVLADVERAPLTPVFRKLGAGRVLLTPVFRKLGVRRRIARLAAAGGLSTQVVLAPARVGLLRSSEVYAMPCGSVV